MAPEARVSATEPVGCGGGCGLDGLSDVGTL